MGLRKQIATGQRRDVVSPTLRAAATKPRRGQHDHRGDSLPSIHPLRYDAATDMRTIDPAIARLLLGRVRATNDLQPLTAEQSQRAAMQRLRFAALYPAVAVAATTQPQQ